MSTNRQSSRNRKSAAPSSVGQTRTTSAAPSTVQTAAPVAPATASQAPLRPAPNTNEVAWAHDYDYIFKDLRKLLIVSVVLFAVIIIIGFFL